MSTELQISGLSKVGTFILNFYQNNENLADDLSIEFNNLLLKTEQENPWFTQNNLQFALEQWSRLFTVEKITDWLALYQKNTTPKKVGLILAGNIPVVGLHDVICVILSGHIPVIKLSSKDQHLIPFILKIWNIFSEGKVEYKLVEKLQNIDAVIATGSNNTAKYLEYYFKDHLSIIRKNRTSVAILKGNETNAELRLLAEDIFRYFGLGCRNVTRLLIPENFGLERLFENFVEFGDIIHHNSYANNYDYNKAIHLLNQDQFWDNNFVMLKESEQLFSPLSVVHFSRYKNIHEVNSFLVEHRDQIQCIVAKDELGFDSENFGQAQIPDLSTYADHVDTMKFLEVI